MALSTIIDAIATALNPTGAQTIQGLRYVDQLDAPKRYVWERTSITQADDGTGFDFVSGGNPKAIGEDLHEFDVHAWGVDYDAAEAMRLNLITALRSVVRPAGFTVGSSRWVEPVWVDYGACLVITVTIRAPQRLRDLATDTDATAQTVVLLTAEIDPAATVGDGILDGLES
jgi:hypothetical protein